MTGAKLNFLAAALFLMLLAGGALRLYAGQITFVFTGVGTGTIGGVGFTNAAFTIASVGDTSPGNARGPGKFGKADRRSLALTQEATVKPRFLGAPGWRQP